jgi:hypothetical protein
MLKEDWRPDPIQRAESIMADIEQLIDEHGEMTADEVGYAMGEGVKLCLLSARMSDNLEVDDENHRKAVIRWAE